MAAHLEFTRLGWRLMPVIGLLMALASARSRTAPPRVVLVWLALTAALAGYVAMIGWGPSVQTLDGLRMQVLAQKAITAVLIAAAVYLSIESDRALAARCSGRPRRRLGAQLRLVPDFEPHRNPPYRARL